MMLLSTAALAGDSFFPQVDDNEGSFFPEVEDAADSFFPEVEDAADSSLPEADDAVDLFFPELEDTALEEDASAEEALPENPPAEETTEDETTEEAPAEEETLTEVTTEEETPSEEPEDTRPAGLDDDVIYLDLSGYEEEDLDALAEEYADQFNGADIRLCINGSTGKTVSFLSHFSFQSLDLDLTASDSETDFYSGDNHLSDIPGLTKLKAIDGYNSYFSQEDVFEDLTDLTLVQRTYSPHVFSRTASRQMPALKHLTLEFSDINTFEDMMDLDFMRQYLLPSSLETVELIIDGTAPSIEELCAIPVDSTSLSVFLGILLGYCQNTTLNGSTLADAQAIAGTSVDLAVIRRVITNSYISSVYDETINGSGDAITASYPDPIYGKILFVVMDNYYGISESSLKPLNINKDENASGEEDADTNEEAETDEESEGFYSDLIPPEMLATSLEEADMLVLIYDENTSVGFYTYGGSAYQVDTKVIVNDLNTGTIYQPFVAASSDPPSTITVTTINGVPMGGSGYGDFLPEVALNVIVSNYDSSVPGKADRPQEEPATAEAVFIPAETEPAPEEEVTVPAEAEAVPAEEETTPAETVPVPEEPETLPSEAAPADETMPADASSVPDDQGFIEEVLAALNNRTYNDTLAALQSGDIVNYGTYSYTAAGVQQTLVDFGCAIAVDGNAGPGTFSALNSVLAAFGQESTTTVDAKLYEELLPLILIGQDEYGVYDDFLRNHYESTGEPGVYDYLKGCVYFAQERYYHAWEAFLNSGYGDYESRMAACVQPWPANGELWHNNNVYGYDMILNFQVNSFDESEGMYFEVYTRDGTLASALFLTGSGTVTTYLPGGIYRIRDCTGDYWFGMKDAFGKDGSYEFMSFYELYEDEYLTVLDSGYEWTITINVTEGDPDAAGISSVGSDWETWTAR